MTNTNNFTKEKEGISDLYWKTAWNAMSAIAVGVAGGRIIKNAAATNSTIYMAMACMMTAAAVGYFLACGMSDYATARVLNMELRKRQNTK